MIDPSPPLNIWLRSEEEIGRLISHFAHTPFRAGRCGLRLGRSILYLAGVRGHKTQPGCANVGSPREARLPEDPAGIM